MCHVVLLEASRTKPYLRSLAQMWKSARVMHCVSYPSLISSYVRTSQRGARTTSSPAQDRQQTDATQASSISAGRNAEWERYKREDVDNDLGQREPDKTGTRYSYCRSPCTGTDGCPARATRTVSNRGHVPTLFQSESCPTLQPHAALSSTNWSSSVPVAVTVAVTAAVSHGTGSPLHIHRRNEACKALFRPCRSLLC